MYTNGGVQLQQRYAPPAQQLGSVGSLSITDWLLLGGGAVVVGSGLTAAVKALPKGKRKLDVVGGLVAAAVVLVGGTAFVSEFRKLTA